MMADLQPGAPVISVKTPFHMPSFVQDHPAAQNTNSLFIETIFAF